MKFKLFLSLIVLMGLTEKLSAGCAFGECRLPRIKKVILANRIINTTDRILTGYRVTPTKISLMIHLPQRNPALYRSPSSIKPITYGSSFRGITAFQTTISYGGDKLNIHLTDNKYFTIECFDFKGRKHTINSTMPHFTTNFIDRIEISFKANTIEISMPRF